MRRRDFIALLSGAIAILPRAVRAQVISSRFRVGYLSYGTQDLNYGAKDAPLTTRYTGDFLTGMRELGYTEGQDFEMLYRFADFHGDRVPQLAMELVQLKPDVIVGPATIQAVALKKATDTIPIVVGVMADPVELGLIKSYAQPGKRDRDNALCGRFANQAA